MPEFGIVRGLAVDSGLDQATNDLFKFDEMNRRAQATSAAQAAMFADDLDFQNAANRHDNPLIKEFAKKQISAIGKFVSENPDWQTNVNKRSQINLMRRELKDNPELNRGLASDTAYKSYLGDLQEVAKNPQQHDVDAYDNVQRQWNNYLQYGNQDGAEALRNEGKKAFIYQKPRDFINLPDTLLKAGQGINPSLVLKGKNLGEYTRTADPKHINAIKDTIWKENGRQIQVEAQKMGLNTPEQVDKWLTDSIMAGVKTTYDPGDPNALWERGMRERELNLRANKGEKQIGGNYTPFDDLMDKRKPSGNVPADIATKVWNDYPKIVIAGNSGQSIDLTGQKMQYDGRYVTDGNGIRRLTGKVNVPIDVAYQTGIWKANDPSDDLTDGEVSGEFLGKAVRRTDDKGKMYLQVDYALPIDKNDGTARQLYNTHAQPDKLVPALEYNPNIGGKPKTIQQNGFTYTLNEKTGQYE